MDSKDHKYEALAATRGNSSIGRVSRSKCCSLIVAATLVLILVSIASFTGLALSLSSEEKLPSGPILGYRKDTIELAKVERFFHSQLSVSTCDIAGDSTHTDFIYVSKKSELTVHQTTQNFESLQFDQEESSAATALVDYLYLLEGSEIKYNLCLGSLSPKEQSGTLFLFDDDLKYYLYQDSPEFGEDLAVLTDKLTIGSSNTTKCKTISYRAPKSAYYFITSRTPGSIFYTFNYTTLVHYYSRKDYQKACSIYEGYPCEVSLPGSFFSTEEYVILAYVQPNVETSAKKNHLCVSSTKQSESITFIVALCGSIGGLALLSVVAIVIISVTVRLYKRRNRKGYVSIQEQPHPPPYDWHFKT